MALISKIRKNLWLVLILLGLALASFVIMDIMGSRSAGGMFNQTTVGEVDGDKIDITEFQRLESGVFSGGTDNYARKASVWEYLVENSLVEKASEALGLGVSKEELMDLQFGNNLSPIIQNNYRNPQTGAVDRQQLLQIKQAIESGQEMNANFREFWRQQEDQVIKTAKQDKINTLVSKAMYTPSWLAEVTNALNTEYASFEYVKVGYEKIADTEVNLSDEDFTNYLNEFGYKYNNKKETRTVEYVVFDVNPSSADSAAILESINALKEEFATTENDSLFAFNNNGGYSYLYTSKEDMQGQLAENIESLEKGDLFGPYVENGYYQIAKISDKRVVADSVKARHILRSVENNDPVQLAAASKFVDSLITLLNNGRAQFDSLAIKHSQDPGSGFNGGDLGTFAQGTMVPAFNNACFLGSRVGGLYKVTTQFGVHLIEVQDIIYNNNDPKYRIAIIGNPIVPSEATQNEVYDQAAELMRNNRTLESLRSAVESSPNLELLTTKPLTANDFSIGNLGSGEESRAIVRWAFTAEKGDVSPAIYTYTDKVNYFNSNYVVAGLKSVQAPGKMSLETAKTALKDQVMKVKKGAMLTAQISGTDLASIAAQFGTIVDTASNVSFNSGFIPGVGVESKVIAKAFGGNPGEVYGPLAGENGVYMIKLISKTPSLAASNIPQLKRSINASARGQVSFRLWDAIKKMVNPSDNRAKFF